jgi:hypothetical protein
LIVISIVTESLRVARAIADPKVVIVKLDLLSPGIEVGVVTTNLDGDWIESFGTL